MIEYAKYVGLTIFAAVFLAIPVLSALSIIFNWGVFLTVLLTILVVSELFLIIFVVEALADNGIL